MSYSIECCIGIQSAIFNDFTWDISQINYLNNTIERLRLDNGVEAISVAIARDNRQVYAKAFGMVDTENLELATTKNRFRVASNSKALTGAAVSHLIDTGQLSLDTLVFGPGNLLGHRFQLPRITTQAERVSAIKVRHLLEHTSGGWGNSSGDPEFQTRYRDLKRDILIQRVISEMPTTSEPGTEYAYSNFGYNILEVVIELITGQSYEQYMRDLLFSPVNATSFAIAGNTLEETLSDEAKYYG